MMIKLGKRMMTALVLTGACMTAPLQAAPAPLDSIAAIASDGVILRSELERRISRISEQLRAQGTALPPTDVLRSQVLDQMILESLQLQEGKGRGTVAVCRGLKGGGASDADAAFWTWLQSRRTFSHGRRRVLLRALEG